MRAFYATHKHIRLFVFGLPEGWRVALYDQEKQHWIDKGGWMHDTLKEAKTDALEKAAAVLGNRLPDAEWH